jgi:hypothetical protein
MSISVVFGLIAMLTAAKSAVVPVPRGIHTVQVNDEWEFTLNTGFIATDTLPLFHASVKFNGWPAGLVNPGGGCIAAGEAANEKTFTEALRVACLAAGIDEADLLAAMGGDL